MRKTTILFLLSLLVLSCKQMPSDSLRVANKSRWNGHSIEEIDQYFKEDGCRYQISCVNWNEFPYQPDVRFSIARDKEYLYVHYQVTADGVFAENTEDMSPVWHDDCVEFFCKRVDDDHYFNFETNCLGALFSNYQSCEDHTNRRDLTSSELASILRVSSLEKKSINDNNTITWTLTIGIPFTILGLDSKHLPEYILGNFYKCGDNTPVPHFLSWQPISTPSPSFHCPEYFGKIYFK